MCWGCCPQVFSLILSLHQLPELQPRDPGLSLAWDALDSAGTVEPSSLMACTCYPSLSQPGVERTHLRGRHLWKHPEVSITAHIRSWGPRNSQLWLFLKYPPFQP